MAALYALPRCTLCAASLHFMRCLAALYALPRCTLCAASLHFILYDVDTTHHTQCSPWISFYKSTLLAHIYHFFLFVLPDFLPLA